MKRFLISIIAMTAVLASSAQKHYKLTVENPEVPGDSIVYDIVEPSSLDYRTHFIADFVKTINTSKYHLLRPSSTGTVKAVFLLDENGFIKDTQIVQKSGFSYEYNLVNIFNSAKPISPGYVNGRLATFLGQFEMTDGVLETIRVY